MYTSDANCASVGPGQEHGPDTAIHGLQAKRVYRWLTLAGGAAILALVGVMLWKGVFLSSEALGAFVRGLGAWGPLAFILIQIVQVIIPVLPGGISLLAGVLLFGPVWGFVYNYAGIVMGSIFAFLIVRKLGRPFLQSIIAKKTFHKYNRWLEGGGKFDRLFVAAILLPVAPDDFLCMLAGLTKMRLRRFVLIIVLCKPLTILVYSIGFTTVAGWINAFFC